MAHDWRRFRNRAEAGGQLAAKLSGYAHRPDVLVMGLPRGGVPVAYEVAMALGVPLDIVVVRKLGVPGEEELAMGAIALGRVWVLNPSLVQSQSVSEAVIDAVTAREQRELTRREHLYRGDRPLPDVHGRTVIPVDDGIATGATMRAAIAAVRQQAPARVVVAVPVVAAYTCDELCAEGNDVVCVRALEDLFAIGPWYEDFPQTTDGEIQALLARAWQARPAAQHAEQDAHP